MSTAALRQAPPARQTTSVVSPLGRQNTRALLVCLLLLVSSVAWRKGTYFSGGVDAVVVAKAALSLLALAVAATAPRRGTPWSELAVGPIPWLALYLAITTLSGFLHSEGLPSAVLASRVVILIITVVLLVRAHPPGELLSALTCGMLLLAAFGSLTGIGSLASTGRLYGGLPPLNANEISLLVSVPLVCLMWRCVQRLATGRDVAAILPCFAVIWLTGTRTGLAAVVLAVCILVLMAPRIPVPLFCCGALMVPATLFVLFFTPMFNTYATRGDTASVVTLNSRTVAWSAALHYPDTPAEQVLGSGLEVKQIPVSAMFRTEQILDSSWMSAFVQSGAAGVTVLALMVVITMVRAATASPPTRSLSVALLFLLVSLSILESGLFDASPAFLAFLCVALTIHNPRLQETP
jgi:hypothetical protein